MVQWPVPEYTVTTLELNPAMNRLFVGTLIFLLYFTSLLRSKSVQESVSDMGRLTIKLFFFQKFFYFLNKLITLLAK